MDHEPPPEEVTPTGQQETSAGSIAQIEKTFLRLTFWQTILSVAGVFTGAVALYAALNESQAVRQQTAASVWPYVQYTINDYSNEDTAEFALTMNNVGVGPARMQAMLLTLDGKAIPDWQSMTETVLGRETRVGIDYGKLSVSHRVLAPGELITVFQTDNTELALKLQEVVYSGTAAISYCYCSIFDDCWISSSAPSAEKQPIQPVDQCPDYGSDGFLD